MVTEAATMDEQLKSIDARLERIEGYITKIDILISQFSNGGTMAAMLKMMMRK